MIEPSHNRRQEDPRFFQLITLAKENTESLASLRVSVMEMIQRVEQLEKLL